MLPQMTWIFLVVALGLVAATLLAASIEREEMEIEETQMYDGDAVALDNDHDGFVHECCECGLRHVVYVKTEEDGTRIRFVRLPEGELKGFKFEGGQVERMPRP